MRVRPFFWLFLACVCIGMLVFAATVQMLVPAAIERLRTLGSSKIELLTDDNERTAAAHATAVRIT